ncbi:glycosyltransferase family 2 protein [Candidatus Woesebacteria bacterium]|nr:glycosyltransferase family 2 protein [Candidatus Woesebacteria bacterium]QQG47017.1 MAG: glycosyltransferase family 2 protein [Candidatus Woesebacteria bacterium]
MKKRVVIIIPTYNEKENIKKMIDELVGHEFPKIDADMQLLVVDDYSPDGTGDIVKDAMKKHKNIHLLQKQKEGLGAAYIAGMKYAQKDLKADAVMEMDADFQHPPRFVKPMVEAFLNGADYAIGSRYIKGGSVPKEWALSRKAVSFFGNLFIRIVLLKPKLHDLTTGFRLTRVKGVLDKIDLDNLMEKKRFAYKVDLLYQSVKNSQKVVEVPLEFAARTKEKSKFNSKEMISTFKVAIILGIKDKIHFIKFAIVGFTGFVINFVSLRIFRDLGFAEVLSWLFSTELAIISNFTFNNIWTFKESKISGISKTISKFIQFNLTSTGALIIQSIAGPIGVGIVGAKYDFIVLFFVVAFLVLPYNYAMYNIVIWKRWKIPGLSKLQKMVG